MKPSAHARPSAALRFAFAGAAFVVLAASIPAVRAADVLEHPLITPYPGSVQSRGEAKDFETYRLITGIDGDNPTGRELEGRLTRLHYYQPTGRSTLEVFKNYEDALAAAGMETIFTCADQKCGPAYAASAWNRFNGITTKSGAECRYLAGRLTTADSTAYVAIMVGRRRHQIDILEVKEMEAGLVKVDAAALARGIERDGRVSVYGIYFDTGKSTLKPESRPALDEIAELMRAMPELKIYVVGHTDSSGSFELNLNLSRERARAVVRQLVETYDIAASRLAGHGVGPLAPASTNRSDPGRSKNRRVDLVEQ